MSTDYDQESLSIKFYQPLFVAAIVYLFRQIINRSQTLAFYVVRLLKYHNKKPKLLKPRWKSNETSKEIYSQYELDQYILYGYFRRTQTSSNKPEEIHMLCFKYYHNHPDIELTQNQRNSILTFIDNSAKAGTTFHPVQQYIQNDIAINIKSNDMSEFREYFVSVERCNKNKQYFLQSIMQLFAILILSIYGIYIMIFEYDFFINHSNQWIYFNDSDIQQYDNLIKWYFIFIIGIKIESCITEFSQFTAANQSRAEQVHTIFMLTLHISLWMSGMVRTGVIFIFLNEIPKIFITIPKLHRTIYSQKSAAENAFLSRTILLISWFIFKILFSFQKLVIQMCFYGSTKLSLYSFIVYTAILLIQVVHVYWFWIIAKGWKRGFDRRKSD